MSIDKYMDNQNLQYTFCWEEKLSSICFHFYLEGLQIKLAKRDSKKNIDVFHGGGGDRNSQKNVAEKLVRI